MKKVSVLIAMAVVVSLVVHRCRTSGAGLEAQVDHRPSDLPHLGRVDQAAAGRVVGGLAGHGDRAAHGAILEQYPPGHDMHDILEKNPHLVTLLDFKNRPLLDAAARAEYEAFLSDKDIMRTVQEDLLYPGSSAYSLADSITREMDVDYFEMAMGWKQNPVRGQLMDAMGEVVLQDNFDAAQHEYVQKSLARSKIRLLQLLYEADPDRARGLAAQSQGTRMEALVAYALDQADHGSSKQTTR